MGVRVWMEAEEEREGEREEGLIVGFGEVKKSWG